MDKTPDNNTAGDRKETNHQSSVWQGPIADRRSFLKKAGAAAFYTPPALAILMQSDRKAIASGGKPGRRLGQNDSNPGNGYGRDRNH